jgi:hypothetical protein
MRGAPRRAARSPAGAPAAPPRPAVHSARAQARRWTLDYDADRAPDPAAWTAAPEADRLAAVEAHHRALAAPHPAVRQPRVHAAIHLVVENQLASGSPPEARRAMDRLVRAGLSRHEALHAIASVVAATAQGALSGARFDPGAYARALDALTAQAWREASTEG